VTADDIKSGTGAVDAGLVPFFLMRSNFAGKFVKTEKLSLDIILVFGCAAVNDDIAYQIKQGAIRQEINGLLISRPLA